MRRGSSGCRAWLALQADLTRLIATLAAADWRFLR